MLEKTSRNWPEHSILSSWTIEWRGAHLAVDFRILLKIPMHIRIVTEAVGGCGCLTRFHSVETSSPILLLAVDNPRHEMLLTDISQSLPISLTMHLFVPIIFTHHHPQPPNKRLSPAKHPPW